MKEQNKGQGSTYSCQSETQRERACCESIKVGASMPWGRTTHSSVVHREHMPAMPYHRTVQGASATWVKQTLESRLQAEQGNSEQKSFTIFPPLKEPLLCPTNLASMANKAWGQK